MIVKFPSFHLNSKGNSILCIPHKISSGTGYCDMYIQTVSQSTTVVLLTESCIESLVLRQVARSLI